jgi:hypothetical protein
MNAFKTGDLENIKQMREIAEEVFCKDWQEKGAAAFTLPFASINSNPANILPHPTPHPTLLILPTLLTPPPKPPNLQRLRILQQHKLLNPPRNLRQPIRRMRPQRHLKHPIELLKRLPLRLAHEQQHKEPQDTAPRCVPRERALRLEREQERGEGDREDEVPEPGRCGGEGHAEFADVEGEGFC